MTITDSLFKIIVDDRMPIEMFLGKSAPGTVDRFAEDLVATRLIVMRS